MTLRESIIPTKKPLAFTFSEIPREKVDVEILDNFQRSYRQIGWILVVICSRIRYW